MNTGMTNHLSGLQSLKIGGLALFVLTCPVDARHETFSERPSRRAERVRQARHRAERDKTEAREWARRRGMQTHYDDGQHVAEIMAIRNGRPLFYTTQNDNAAISTAADQVRATAPFNVDGTGVTVGIWDGGAVMTNHQEFGSRIVLKDGGIRHYHATHVGGTIGASGVVAQAEGMAPNVGIDSYDWYSDDAEMFASAAAYPGEPGKIYLSNHSYGFISGWFYMFWTNPYTGRAGYHWWGDINAESVEDLFGQYNTYTRSWDEIVYNAPYYLPFKSAGNENTDDPAEGSTVYFTPDDGITWPSAIYDSSLHPGGDGIYKSGYDTISAHGNAKNIMTVGAVNDAELDGVRDLTKATKTSFSSWGPADDGRIKPDIMANGSELYSCNVRSTSSYASRSGTSMSTPNACGSAALLVDYYDDLFPGQAMRASMLKGLIIHTADDLGQPGPDYQHGWGLMNTREAAQLLKNYSVGNLIRLTEAMLEPSSPVDIYTGFVDSGEPMRVTLCWTDPPGPATSAHDDRTPVLVNDLDLTVTGPDGTHYPYKLNYEDPFALATANSENNVDNVEQVYIAAPITGTYTITVNHDGTLSGGSQWYSLLTSGIESDLDGDGLTDNWEGSYFGNSTNALDYADADGDGYDNLSEYISGSDPTNAESVFEITAISSFSSTGHPPFVITWDGTPGRTYDVNWTRDLILGPFINIVSNLPAPIYSYTDTVYRTEDAGFYRVDVRMDQ